MKRLWFPPALLVITLLVTGRLMVAADPMHAHPARGGAEPQVVRLTVTREGFKTDAAETSLTVEQGRPVEVVFVYGDEGANNPHRIFMQGPNQLSDELSAQNREVHFKFIPTQTGTLIFRCMLTCDGHMNLQNGQLKVVPPTPAGADGGAGATAPTAMTVTAAHNASNGSPINLAAILRDSSESPIAGAPVRFYVDSGLFAGKAFEVGSAITDSKGVASLRYTPHRTGEITVTARFEGIGAYQSIEGAYTLRVEEAGPAYREEPRGLAIGRWAPAGVALVLLAVWGTYAFIGYNLFRIVWHAEGDGS